MALAMSKVRRLTLCMVMAISSKVVHLILGCFS
jgi:hypothetical protein